MPRPRVLAVHVDHGLRGAESEADARFCEELCTRLGVSFERHTLTLDPGPPSLEARARQARYACLGQSARQSGDLTALVASLAAQIADERDRSRFLTRLESGTTQFTRTTATTAATGSTGSVATGVEVSEALVAHATQVMTRSLGPIAKVLVRKALAQKPGPARFLELLVDMADGVDRGRLLRELQAPPGP